MAQIDQVYHHTQQNRLVQVHIIHVSVLPARENCIKDQMTKFLLFQYNCYILIGLPINVVRLQDFS